MNTTEETLIEESLLKACDRAVFFILYAINDVVGNFKDNQSYSLIIVDKPEEWPLCANEGRGFVNEKLAQIFLAGDTNLFLSKRVRDLVEDLIEEFDIESKDIGSDAIFLTGVMFTTASAVSGTETEKEFTEAKHAWEFILDSYTEQY